MLDYSPFSRPSAALVCAAVLSFTSCLTARVTHDVSNTPLHSHQRSRFTGHQRSSSQTGTFGGAPSQEMSATADNPPGLSYNRNFADDRKSRAGVAGMRARPAGSIPTSHFQQKGRGHDGRHSGGNSGVKAREITRKSSFQESSRLWQPSQGPDGTRKSYGGRVQSYASYLGTLQQIPERDYGGYKEKNKMATMRPYEGLKISQLLVSGRQPAPQVPPMEINQIYSRNKKIPWGQSYLFNQPQNSTKTVKPASSAIIFSRDQQRGSAETQTPAHPAKGTEAEYAASSQEAAVNGHVSGGATHVSKPTQTSKRLFGYRGFEHLKRGANKEPSKEDPGQRGFDKGRFTMSNLYPALLAEYRFSQREKQEGAQRDPSLTAQRPITPGSKESHLRVPGSVNESNPHQRHFNTSRLQGFDSSTHEGAKPLIHKSDKPVKVQRGLEGFFQTNPHIWGPEKGQIHRWYKGTGAGAGDVSATGEIRREDPKVPSKTNGSTEAGEEFTLDRYRKNRKIFTFLTLHLNQTHQEFKEQNHPRIPPGNFGTAGNQTEVAAKPEPPSKSHQSTRTDATNAAISRAPARPAGLWSFNYTDVLGKASFSGVGVTVKMLAAEDAPAMTLLTET
ncbi:uncharacterized protein [Takifugu rubripes]|uniref:uncharacterized protein n=1 Tax=Takifugu rubripes TaxID=31033 RepID=UPI001145CFD9|nr:uncharacterized protein LOC105416847 [Takifugu rubripes]